MYAPHPSDGTKWHFLVLVEDCTVYIKVQYTNGASFYDWPLKEQTFPTHQKASEMATFIHALI